MSAMEQALRIALARAAEQIDSTWPEAAVAKKNAEAMLSGRLRPEDYLRHARDQREVA